MGKKTIKKANARIQLASSLEFGGMDWPPKPIYYTWYADPAGTILPREYFASIRDVAKPEGAAFSAHVHSKPNKSGLYIEVHPPGRRTAKIWIETSRRGNRMPEPVHPFRLFVTAMEAAKELSDMDQDGFIRSYLIVTDNTHWKRNSDRYWKAIKLFHPKRWRTIKEKNGVRLHLPKKRR